MSDRDTSEHRGGEHHGAAHPDHHVRPEGYEREIDRTINLRGVALTVFGILFGTALAMVAMWLLYDHLLAGQVAREPAPSPMPEARQTRLPPAPRLQGSPEAELERFRARENAKLSSYGWKDEAAGIVRIPVSRAVEVLAEEGRGALSTAPDPSAGDTEGGQVPAGTGTAPAAAPQGAAAGNPGGAAGDGGTGS